MLIRCGQNGVHCVGEGTPQMKNAGIDTGVLENDIPVISGVWLVDDRNADAGTGDGPAGDQFYGTHRFGVGYSKTIGGGADCVNTSDTDPTCDHVVAGIKATTSEMAHMTMPFSTWGVDSQFLEDLDLDTTVLAMPCINNLAVGTATTRATTACTARD